jgi:hypothetical protein
MLILFLAFFLTNQDFYFSYCYSKRGTRPQQFYTKMISSPSCTKPCRSHAIWRGSCNGGTFPTEIPSSKTCYAMQFCMLISNIHPVRRPDFGEGSKNCENHGKCHFGALEKLLITPWTKHASELGLTQIEREQFSLSNSHVKPQIER